MANESIEIDGDLLGLMYTVAKQGLVIRNLEGEIARRDAAIEMLRGRIESNDADEMPVSEMSIPSIGRVEG